MKFSYEKTGLLEKISKPILRNLEADDRLLKCSDPYLTQVTLKTNDGSANFDFFGHVNKHYQGQTATLKVLYEERGAKVKYTYMLLNDEEVIASSELVKGPNPKTI